MMQAMKGATQALGSMNRSMNLPSLQRIAMEFERENDVMEQRQEMMDDAIDDAMDVGAEEEGDEIVEQVMEELGVDLNQAVGTPFASVPVRDLTASQFGETPTGLQTDRVPESRVAQAVGSGGGGVGGGGGGGAGGGSGGGDPDDDDLQARLDSLRK